MIPLFLAQTNLPPPSISFSWQAALLVIFLLTVASLWKNVFPKKQPPPEVDAALVESRLVNLEQKDQRDIDSRKTMHREIADANKLMGELKLVVELAKVQIPSMPQIRDEIDRSIKAGEGRVAALQNSIDAYEESRQSDVKDHGERIASLESWRREQENKS